MLVLGQKAAVNIFLSNSLVTLEVDRPEKKVGLIKLVMFKNT